MLAEQKRAHDGGCQLSFEPPPIAADLAIAVNRLSDDQIRHHLDILGLWAKGERHNEIDEPEQRAD